MLINRNLNVFIANRDAHARAKYHKYFQGLGLNNVALYDNSKQCMNQLVRKPDIIFIDNNILTVYEAAKVKKIRNQYPGVFVVFVANRENMQYAFQTLADGTFDYMINGNGEDVMTNAVKHVLEIVSEKPDTTNRRPFSASLKKGGFQKVISSLFHHFRIHGTLENCFSVN